MSANFAQLIFFQASWLKANSSQTSLSQSRLPQPRLFQARLFQLMLLLGVIMSNNFCFAEFRSKYNCHNQARVCTQAGGYRSINGVPVYRDCWQYSYKKICEVDSVNDCHLFAHCQPYSGENNGSRCLEQDYDYCLNRKIEFVCPETVSKEQQKTEIITDPEDGNTRKLLHCRLKCMNGDCFNIADNPNEDMAESLALLQASMKMSDGVSGMDGKITENIFGGRMLHCNKKKLNYRDCCVNKGWGQALGAGCSAESLELNTLRHDKNLCIEVGTKETTFTKKYYFCCYKNHLEKAAAQLRGKNQLFEHDCRGFTLEQLKNIDFQKDVDLTEFKQEIMKRAQEKMANYDGASLQRKIQANLPNIQQDQPEEKKHLRGMDEGAASELQRNNQEDQFNSKRLEIWRQKTAN